MDKDAKRRLHRHLLLMSRNLRDSKESPLAMMMRIRTWEWGFDLDDRNESGDPLVSEDDEFAKKSRISLKEHEFGKEAEEVFRSGCRDLREKALEWGAAIARADGCAEEQGASEVKTARLLAYLLSGLLSHFCAVCAIRAIGLNGFEIKQMYDLFVDEYCGQCPCCGRDFYCHHYGERTGKWYPEQYDADDPANPYKQGQDGDVSEDDKLPF